MGRLVVRNMNSRHAKVTDWGLAQIVIRNNFLILDIGCGCGRTVSKLATIATNGKVCGLDFSDASIAVATKTNSDWIQQGRVEIRQGSVSQMPFAADTFDLVVAVETHFWWPHLAEDMCEVFRVLRPGGTLAIIAEVYRGAGTTTARLAEKYLPRTGMKLLSPDEHRQIFADAGYADVKVTTESNKGWIFAAGSKKFEDESLHSGAGL